MGNPRQCANCKSALPPDHPPDHPLLRIVCSCLGAREGFTAEALSLRAPC
jgi:hypothetical protein